MKNVAISPGELGNDAAMSAGVLSYVEQRRRTIAVRSNFASIGYSPCR